MWFRNKWGAKEHQSLKSQLRIRYMFLTLQPQNPQRSEWILTSFDTTPKVVEEIGEFFDFTSKKESSSHSPLEDLQQGFKCPQCAAPRRRFARKLGDKIGTTLDGAWGEEINLVRSGGKCGFSGVRLGDLEKSEQHEHLFGCANLLWVLDMFFPLSLNKLTIYFLWTWGRPRAICFVVWLFKV